MSQYYISVDGVNRKGPFSKDELVNNGLTSNSLVWCKGMSGWTKASDVPEIASLLYLSSHAFDPFGLFSGRKTEKPESRVDPKAIEQFLLTVADKIPNDKIPEIRHILQNIDPETFKNLMYKDLKNPFTSLVLSICGGLFGVDRFYIGDNGGGVLKLLTCGGGFFWWIIDWFLIMNATKNHNYDMLMSDF